MLSGWVHGLVTFKDRTCHDRTRHGMRCILFLQAKHWALDGGIKPKMHTYSSEPMPLSNVTVIKIHTCDILLYLHGRDPLNKNNEFMEKGRRVKFWGVLCSMFIKIMYPWNLPVFEPPIMKGQQKRNVCLLRWRIKGIKPRRDCIKENRLSLMWLWWSDKESHRFSWAWRTGRISPDAGFSYYLGTHMMLWRRFGQGKEISPGYKWFFTSPGLDLYELVRKLAEESGWRKSIRANAFMWFYSDSQNWKVPVSRKSWRKCHYRSVRTEWVQWRLWFRWKKMMISGNVKAYQDAEAKQYFGRLDNGELTIVLILLLKD